MSAQVPGGLRRQLLEHPELTAEDRDVVARFITWCEAYALLEYTVLGDLAFDMPLHGVEITPDDPARLEGDTEVLAAAAMNLLSLEVPVTGLAHALEAHGARVFQMPLSRGVLGVFFFAGETAPAFLVNACLTTRAAHIALAHLYSHFLVDVDPYTPTVCRMSSERGVHAHSEDFADAFAEALLVPRSVAGQFAEMGGAIDIHAMSDYLELPASFVATRVSSLGYDAAGATPDYDDWWRENGETVFPERLVALALEGIHEDKIDVEEFSAALGISRDDAVGLLALSAAPPDEDSATEDPPEPDDQPASAD